MPEKDQPPEHIWLDDDALSAHFEQVKASYGAQSSGDTEPATPLQQNELTRSLKGAGHG